MVRSITTARDVAQTLPNSPSSPAIRPSASRNEPPRTRAEARDYIGKGFLYAKLVRRVHCCFGSDGPVVCGVCTIFRSRLEWILGGGHSARNPAHRGHESSADDGLGKSEIRQSQNGSRRQTAQRRSLPREKRLE